ncbi:MAG: hypothetical protein RLZZ491_2388 [Pseudomonadota bacterium]|jgi:ribosome-associated translation inhibitor RaiA/cold shock CspA family protein
MQTPLDIAFSQVAPTDEIKDLIHEKAAHLGKMCSAITSCHVHVRAPHRSQRHGNLYEVTIEVHVPGKALVVHHRQKDAARHEHLRVAIRDAFADMSAELKAWNLKAAGAVKSHDGPVQGTVVDMHPVQQFGQILTTDHRLIYFHENSVLNGDFDKLRPGDPVELVVQAKESVIGPQASTVRLISSLAFDPATKPSRRA